MPLFAFVAALFASAQVPAPAPAAFIIAAPGSAEERLGLHRLIFESWSGRGAARPLQQGAAPAAWSACMTRNIAALDLQCVRRLLPRRYDGVPVVALIVLPAPNRHYRTILHCVGARGAGSDSFIYPLAGIDRSNRQSRLSNNSRSSVARCINEAAPGTVTGDPW